MLIIRCRVNKNVFCFELLILKCIRTCEKVFGLLDITVLSCFCREKIPWGGNRTTWKNPRTRGGHTNSMQKDPCSDQVWNPDKWCHGEVCGHVCENHTLSAPLGSSVLLPCNITNSSLNEVLWKHTAWGNLVELTSDGRVNFLFPKQGRVKVFPNQHSKGKYSMRIDELQNSDLGCYCCMQRDGPNCHQLELVVATAYHAGALKEGMWLLIICVGVASSILLSICSYLLYRNRTRSNTINLVGPGSEAANALPAQDNQEPVQEQLRGIDNNSLVYDNDDQHLANQQDDPTRNHCSPPGALQYLGSTGPGQSTTIYPSGNQQLDFKRGESKRRKLRFQGELFSRLRQASLSGFYANQSEINKQLDQSANAQNQKRAGFTKKAKENQEYKNPIYNRSTEQLHHP
ncbi:uncharacterized protein LOC131463116 isoform X3 [Solea solea]|uniref:uncharacterized protein LOC131463116 isoform X3 n=1 Tax=Solea solea TaxID=90069 RepID=UPI00272B733D|nr:uncharacterized protein LOC131463116 isoform X3 [Solea solea]